MTNENLTILKVVCVVIVIAIAIFAFVRKDTYTSTPVMTEKELNALPTLDLGDGEATEENVTPADIIGIGEGVDAN